MSTHNRGFAGMKDRERQREIARKGGIVGHLKGVAHEWTHAEAQAAGKKGGTVSSTNARRRKARESAA